MRKRTLGVLLLTAGILLGFSIATYTVGLGAAAVIFAWAAGITTIVSLLAIGLVLIGEESGWIV